VSVGEFLPPVVTRLSMNMDGFASAVAEAKALIKSIGGDANVQINADLNKPSVAAALTDITSITNSFNGANVRIGADVNDASLLAALAEIKAAVATLGTAAGVDSAAGAGGRLLFGWLNANTLHWIIAGGAEILAVTVPAFVALGAAAAVAMQGVMNVDQHMESVYTATEATANIFHTTAGQLVGMGDALQKAQNAANPDVYSILGSAIITVNEHFGNLAQTGLQVVEMFQTFAAKVAVDFGPGGSMGSTVSDLLSKMVPDLQELGQLFGNLGHAVLSFASQMPGLAEILLSTFSHVAGWVSDLVQLSAQFNIAGVSVLKLAMGYEEFNRWGGLVATMLTKIGLASADLQGGAFSLTRFQTVVQGLLSVFPMAISYMAKFAAMMGADSAASGLTGAAESLAGVIEKINPGIAIAAVAAAVGIGVLVDKLLTGKTAAQAFADSLQNATMKASNTQAFQQITQNIAQLNQQLAQTPAKVATATGVYARLAGPVYQANGAVAQLNAGITQQQQDLINVTQGAAYLATTYKTNLTGAMELADLANVKLASGITGTGQSAQIARMQIASLVQGYESMGSPMTAVGADMTALAIQSGLASTKVSSLNQAWDQFMQNLAGGTGGLAGFVTSLQNMGSVAATTSNNLGTSGGISLSVNQFAASLKNFGTTGSAAWTNFDQVVGSTAPQLIDWLRTAGAEGALSGTQFTNAVLGMVGSMTQLASESPTAQAELLGLVQQVDPNIQTWGQLTQTIKNTGASLKDTQNAVQQATIKMGDMAQVAANLGTVMQNDLLTTLSQAKIGASGAGAAMQTYEQDIMNAGTSATKTAGDRANLIRDLENLGYSAKQAAALIQLVANNLNALPSSKDITVNVHEYVTTSGKSATSTLNPGYASGTPAARPGWAWVGEAGPELVRFRGGETVVPNHIATGYAGGAGMDDHSHPIVINLDGRQVYSSMQQHAVQSQRRTGHAGLQKRSR
jgi:hypothetical protein